MRERSLHRPAALLLLASTAACIQSVHGDGPSSPPMPGGEARVLVDKPGRGAPVLGGDRITVDFSGRYRSGEEWGSGTFTLVYGNGTYPGAVNPVRVGSVIKMQYVVHPSDTGVRLIPFPGGDAEHEAFQVRRDRGQIVVEHKVKSVCRPLKLFVINTGLGPIETSIGCWHLWRSAPPRVDPRQAEIERMIAEVNSGKPGEALVDSLVEPPVVPRPRADTSKYLGPDGLHRAAREGRPELVGWLIARGRDPSAPDAHGFAPIHYVGFAQRPLERFVPSLEQAYSDVVDTLLAHGAAVDAKVQPGTPLYPTLGDNEFVGQTALGFAGTECADRLVDHLLQLGADPNAHGAGGNPALTGAALNGCPEVVRMLLAAHAAVDAQPAGGGTPLERLAAVSAFHQGHLACARLLVDAGANPAVAAERLAARLKDPGQGGFGFSNRPMARRVLTVLRGGPGR